MSVFKAIMSNFGIFLLAFFVTLVPYAGLTLPGTDTAEENSTLTVDIISDVHIEEKEIFKQAFLKCAFKNISNSKCDIDAVIVPGDVTNYADEPTLAKYYEIIDKYCDVPVITAAGNHDIGHAGDRDVTDITKEQALQNFIDYRNEYLGTDYDVNYYSTEINGYKFIILGDEVVDGGHWDAISMTDEQLAFLDRELAEGTKDGKPVFVICHWPLEGTTSEDTVWPDSAIDAEDYDIAPILEKYENVFWISGHMHSGVKCTAMDEWFGLTSVEVRNGVTYVNLPSFGFINSFGIPWSGTGFRMEVYEGKVLIRPRNYLTNKWYTNANYEIPLV